MLDRIYYCDIEHSTRNTQTNSMYLCCIPCERIISFALNLYPLGNWVYHHFYLWILIKNYVYIILYNIHANTFGVPIWDGLCVCFQKGCVLGSPEIWGITDRISTRREILCLWTFRENDKYRGRDCLCERNQFSFVMLKREEPRRMPECYARVVAYTVHVYMWTMMFIGTNLGYRNERRAKRPFARRCFFSRAYMYVCLYVRVWVRYCTFERIVKLEFKCRKYCKVKRGKCQFQLFCFE